MKRTIPIWLLALSVGAFADSPAADEIPVSDGVVRITFLGHATLMLEYSGTVIHVDPVRAEGDYSSLPKADIVLVTHEHSDHLDLRAIAQIRTPETVIIGNGASSSRIDGAIALKNGESTTARGIVIDAIPAYNTTQGRERYHPRGNGNGYLLTLGGKRFYIAGDTEDTPEMLALDDVYVAFLPANQPYTMLTDQVIRAAKAFRPSILYPYHFGSTDVNLIVEGLAEEPDIEVRIRDLD